MEKYNFDLDEEMVKELSEEFAPLDFVKTLKLSQPHTIEDARASLEKYGRELARRSIEKGEKKIDRVYHIMKKAMEKTGEMKFPFIPQRYLEIAYLSIQPFRRLRIVANSSKFISYRLNECSLYKAIEEQYGKEAANKMVCKSACFALIEEILSHFDFDIKPSLETSMADDGKCQFRIERK